MKKRILCAFAAVMMLLSLGLTAFAADSQAEHAAKQPDYDRKGSITVNLEGSGGTLSLYQVAVAYADDGNNLLRLTSAFQGAGVTEEQLMGMTEEDNGATDLAAKLLAHAEKNGVKPAATGTVFSNLELGVYLVAQNQTARGYWPIRPFLITVPRWDGEKLVYAINAKPKPEQVQGVAMLDPPVRKIVVPKKEGQAVPRTTPFTFRLTALDSGPMPGDRKESTMDMTVTGAGVFEFGWITYRDRDIGKTYTYRIEELKGTAANYTYDAAVYTMTVKVTEEKELDGVLLEVSYTDKNGKAVGSPITGNILNGTVLDAVSFTNIYDGTGKLPQTGQLWWPVPVLTAAGIICLMISFTRKKRKKG